MALPALHIWQEGVDVLPQGIIARVFWPRYYPYETLETWYFDSRANRRMLTVWHACQYKVLECRAGHLTDVQTLLAALRRHVPYRHWPN